MNQWTGELVNDSGGPLKGFKSGNKCHRTCTASRVLYGNGGKLLREEITDGRPARQPGLSHPRECTDTVI